MTVSQSPEQWSPSAPASEIAPGFWRLPMPIPGHSLAGVCAYLVRDHDGYVLIDAGMDVPACTEAFDTHLATLGVSASAIHTIVLTHCHADHGGQAHRLRDRSGAQIWLHAHDAPLVRRHNPIGDGDLDGLVGWLTRYGFPPEEAEDARRSVDHGLGETFAIEADRLLEGNETFAVGPYRFEVVWTPGHTPGHVCVYEATQRIVLTGDHLFGQANPNVRLMAYSPLDTMRRYLDSLERVGGLQARRAMPAHGDPFEQVAERTKQVIGHQLRRRDQLLSLMTPSPQTPYKLAQIVWGSGTRTSWESFHGRLRRNAALTLAAHLEQLALDGAVARLDAEGTVGFAQKA
jgi:glyoxylase-like metal-dependent hydrolase (beta-lactamase superfamily II)